MEIVPESQFERELQKVLQIPVSYNQHKDYPYSELSGHHFELLLLSLFRRGIETGKYVNEIDRAYQVKLPLGERTIFLELKGEVRGAVMHARRQGQVTLPSLSRDIIRFLLYTSEYSDAWKKRPDFKLFYALSGTLTGRALEFAQEFNERIRKERGLGSWIQEVLETSGLSAPADEEKWKENLVELFSIIELELILPTHLDDMVNTWPDLRSIFFGVEMVSAEQLLKKVVDQFNIRDLGDEEAHRLLDRLEKIPEENRMGIGLLNFFGYDKGFIEYIAGSEKLREIMMKGAEFKAEIDYAMVGFLLLKARFFSSILLSEQKQVSPLVELAMPAYIFSKFAIKYVKNIDSKILNEIIRNSREYEFYEAASVELIRDRLVQECRQVGLKHSKGEIQPTDKISPEQARRQDLLLKTWKEIKDAEDLKRSFDEEWEQLRPTITAIEKKMLLLLPHNTTIVIEDMGVLDDDSRFQKLMKKIREKFSGKN